MRQDLYCRTLVIASALAASWASAQTTSQDNSARMNLEGDPPPLLNRFGLNYRMGFNISAKFKNIGGYAAPSNPRLYDNGYVLDDGPYTPADITWNWGYTGLPSSTGLPRR